MIYSIILLFRLVVQIHGFSAIDLSVKLIFQGSLTGKLSAECGVKCGIGVAVGSGVGVAVGSGVGVGVGWTDGVNGSYSSQDSKEE